MTATEKRANEGKTNNTIKSARRAMLLAAAVTGISGAASVASAASLFWDANGATTTAVGGTGTWSTANTWRDGSTTGTLQSWVDGNDAKLPTAAGTITLTAPVAANSIEFLNTSGAYTLTGSSVSVGTAGIIITSPTGEQRIASALGSTDANGDINYVRSGAVNNTSRLALQGVNTFTGNIRVTSTVGSTTAAMTSTAARLDLNNAGAYQANTDFLFFSNNGAISNSGPNGTVLTFGAGNTIDFNAGASGTTQNGAIGGATGNTVNLNTAIGGNVNLYFQSATGGGAGTTNVNVAQTYTGTTLLNTGINAGQTTGLVVLGVNNALPTGTTLIIGTDATTFGSGALDLAGFNQSVAGLRTGTNATSAQNSAGIANSSGTTSTLTVTGNQTNT
jgi:hypothetical protein